MQIAHSFVQQLEQPKSQEALFQLLTYRNKNVVLRYMKDGNVSREEAEVAFEAFLQFMAVCVFKDGRATATEATDGIWHAFLLHTKQYREFCETYLGGFVDHEPSADEDSARYYAETRAFAETMFGTLDEHAWPKTITRARCFSGKISESRRFN